MKVHDLKTLPVYFDAVKRGDKTFEIRKNDRDFQTGDQLCLQEYDPAKQPPPPPFVAGQAPAPMAAGDFTGRRQLADVTYVLHDPWEKFGLRPGYVVLGIALTKEARQVNLAEALEVDIED